jgi:hypothetical protein
LVAEIPIAAAVKELPVPQAYLDGELCGVRPGGTISFDSFRPRTSGATTRHWSSSSSTSCLWMAKI